MENNEKKKRKTVSQNENVSKKTVKLAKMGVLSGIGILLLIFRFPIIPGVQFLEYDPADIPILIGTFAFGPLAGLMMTVVISVVQGLILSAQSGPYGVLMHIIATGSFVIVGGNIYKFKKTRGGAAIALIFGSIAMVLVMIPANLIITPIFMGVPQDAVQALILPAIVPFNLAKAGINAVITFFLYKRISKFLH